MEVTQRTDGVDVKVAYGTSQKLDRMLSGEFAIRRLDNAAAYTLAGLSYDTKFNLGETIALPWSEAYFGVPPRSRFGQTPKLGSLHSCMMKSVESALRAVRSAQRA